MKNSSASPQICPMCVKTAGIRVLNHLRGPPDPFAEKWPGFVTQSGTSCLPSRKERSGPDPLQTDLWAGKPFAPRSSARFVGPAQNSGARRRLPAQRHRQNMATTLSVDAIAAQRAKAHSIELCSDLASGGVTPSAGFMEAARERLCIPTTPSMPDCLAFSISV